MTNKTIGTLARRRAESSRRRKADGLAASNVEERLLAASARLLENDRRFGGVSVEELAREAGIGRATFYIHFRSKSDLVVGFMERLTAEITQSAGDWFNTNGPLDARDMRQALTGIVKTFKANQAVLAAVADMAPTDDAVAAAHQEMMDRLCALSRQSVRQVHAEGRGSDVDPDQLADMLTWLIELYCARFISGYDGNDVNRLVDMFSHIAGRAIFEPSVNEPIS